MTIKTIKEGFALMGAILRVDGKSITVGFKDVSMSIDLNAPEDQVKAALFFLKLNIPNWYNLVKEALAEEQKGE